MKITERRLRQIIREVAAEQAVHRVDLRWPRTLRLGRDDFDRYSMHPDMDYVLYHRRRPPGASFADDGEARFLRVYPDGRWELCRDKTPAARPISTGELPKVLMQFDIPYELLSKKGFLDLGVKQDVTEDFDGDIAKPISAWVVDRWDDAAGGKLKVEFKFRDVVHAHEWAFVNGYLNDEAKFKVDEV